MFAGIRYLEWARRFYGQVRFDLATSGMPVAPADGVPPAGAPADAPDLAEALRLAIAAHNDVPRDEAVPAMGTTHALWLAYTSLVAMAGGESPDEILVEDPAYEPLVTIAEGVGARVARFARDPRDGYALDPDRVARAMTPRTRAIVVTNLHNPSGVRSGDDALRAVARVAEARGAFVVVNEVYAELGRWVDERGVFRGSARRLGPNVVAVSSLTKSYGLGPDRIGWVVGPKAVASRADDALTATTGHWPRSYLRSALAGFARTASLADRARGILAGKRERVAAWTARHGLSWSAPSDSLFGLVRMPGRGDLTAIIEAGVRDQEVLVAPGQFFGVPDAFRLAWGLPADALEEGLDRLARVLSIAPVRP